MIVPFDCLLQFVGINNFFITKIGLTVMNGVFYSIHLLIYISIHWISVL